MKKLITVILVTFFAMPAWAQAQQQTGAKPPTKEENDQFSALLRKYAKLKEDCDVPAAKAEATKQVRKQAKRPKGGWGLNPKKREEVQVMIDQALKDIRNSDCCEEVKVVVSGLEDRMNALEKRMDGAEDRLEDHEGRITELEKNTKEAEVRINSRMSHLEEMKNNTSIKLRAWSEIFGSAAHVYAAAQFGGSIIFQQHRQWKRGESEKEGYLLIGLSGSVGTALQSSPDMTYATGGFVAWQWPFGLYLGATGEFLVEGMDPSQHWFVGGGLLLGATIPRPTKNPKASFFLEGFVGPAGRLSGEPGWPDGWSFVPMMGGRLGIQFL